ncbi:CTP synthase [anaerobic digester metagenome]
MWEDFLYRLKNPVGEVNIALVGKYVELKDAYKSILESFIHAGASNHYKVKVKLVHSEFVTDENVAEQLAGMSGILVAPGFGERGIEGKIISVRYARENNIPFLGICLGMQVAVIEFARNVLNLEGAHSREMDRRTPHPVIDIMESQKKVSGKGGTMRLGLYPCKIKPGSKVSEVYHDELINERHRHRYEFNNKYIEMYSMAGMLATGINPNEDLVEIVELENHPWFVGVQFHPEYRSTVENPHPLFVRFVQAAIDCSKSK